MCLVTLPLFCLLYLFNFDYFFIKHKLKIYLFSHFLKLFKNKNMVAVELVAVVVVEAVTEVVAIVVEAVVVVAEVEVVAIMVEVVVEILFTFFETT